MQAHYPLDSAVISVPEGNDNTSNGNPDNTSDDIPGDETGHTHYTELYIRCMDSHLKYIMFTCTISTPKHTLVAPPKKKQKREKKSKVEKAMEKTMDAFAKHQVEVDERYQKREDERWKKELEIEERQRKENQEHQLRMMQMLGQMFQHRPSYPPPTTSPYYEFNYHDDTF